MTKQIQIHPTQKAKSRAKLPCKCLICARSHEEKLDDKTLLVCGDEACDMRCDVCTARPYSGHCGYRATDESKGKTRSDCSIDISRVESFLSPEYLENLRNEGDK